MTENELYDLEDLRNQVALLKAKLDKQQIINESMIKRAMNAKINCLSNSLNSEKLFIFRIILFFIAPWIFYLAFKSIVLACYIDVMLIINEVFIIHIQKLIPQSEDINDDLLSFRLRIERFKQAVNIRLYVVIILSIILIIWTLAVMMNPPFIKYIPLICINMGIGMAIGFRRVFLLFRYIKDIEQHISDIRGMRNIKD